MRPHYVSQDKLEAFIEAALEEDIGDGDHSSLASIPGNASNTAKLVMKADGILAGIEIAREIFKKVDPELELNVFKEDGDAVSIGDVVFTVSGKSQSILTAERLVLNCMQRMSGIASYTRYLNSLIEGSRAKLLDTRKTTPNFRMFEKWAVLIGGGKNHRYGLYDMIMLKDNHIDFAGSITAAVEASVDYLQREGRELKIEVEVRNLKEVEEALATEKVDRVMLDNMSVEEMRKAVSLINHKVETEASGGITEETIGEVAKTGVDFISVGALTHSIKSLDMSLKAMDK